MAYNTPNVGDGALLNTGSAPIPVGSSQWYDWLEESINRSFYYRDGYHTFTARKEQRHGGWYWYAYRRHQGKLHTAYIGKSHELDLIRLSEVARNLVKADEPVSKPTPTKKVSQKELDTPRALPAEDTGLLSTKLFVPMARTRFVPRARLTARLDNLLEKGQSWRLILVTAPAGFGKTTLLSHWLIETGLPVAWLSLEEGDDDPARFWSYVLAALNGLLTELDLQITLPGYPAQAPNLDGFLTALINRLSQIPGDFTLVLDDYHLLKNESVLSSITFLLNHLPPRMHLALTSRSTPTLPLARWRSRNELVEINAADLRFTSEEAATFLNEVMGLDLRPEAVETLEDRTEGWAAGLQLAALSLQGRDSQGISRFLESPGQSHRFALDYLAEEVLARQSADIQTFLLQTSIVDRLSAPLAETLSGREDSQLLLEKLEQANLFITSLDDEKRWYRYHVLFAEFLRGHLRRTQPDQWPVLQRRAAEWYEKHEQFGEALAHWLAAQETERAADLVESRSEQLLMRGEEATLQNWMSALPPELITARPQLAVHYSWTLLATSSFEEIEKLLKNAERAIGVNLSEDPTFIPSANLSGPRRGRIQSLVAEIIAIRASVANQRRDADKTIELTQQALELLPQKHRLRAVVSLDLGYAQFLRGNLKGAWDAFAEATQVAQLVGDISSHIVGASQLAVLSVRQGKLQQAAELYQQVLRIATGPDGQPLPNADGVYLNLAMLLYEWSDLEGCIRHIQQSVEISRLSRNLEMEVESYILLSRVRQAQGRTEETDPLWQKIDELLASYNVPWYLSSVQARRARLYLVQGRVAEAAEWAEHSGLGLDDELSALNKRTTEYIILASLLIAQQRPELAFQLLDRLLEASQKGGYRSREIWITALQALAYQAQGRFEPAIARLEEALRLGAPEGFLRTFADEGQPMARLLSRFLDECPESLPPAYVRKLRQLFKLGQTDNNWVALPAPVEPVEDAPALPGQPALPAPLEPLSRRELEVLRLLAANKSNAAIANSLTLTLGTVKIHLKNIYKKLDVHSRQQAISQARQLDLL